MTTKIWGIDVSKYNYPIDWNKVKNAGVEFAILRVGFASTSNRNNLYIDPYFEKFYKDAKSVGMPVGGYFYSRCNSVETAKSEAKFIINTLKNKKLEYPVWLDVEDAKTLKTTSKSNMTKAVKTCLDELEKAGYYVGIYSGKYILRDELNDNELKDYDHWIAQYSKECTYYSKHTMWQFGGETNLLRSKKINGIGNDVADQNYCYIDYPTIIKTNGLNGYPKPTVGKEDTYITNKVSFYITNKVSFYIQTKGKLNIREKASMEGKILYTAPKGVKYKITKMSSNGKWGYAPYRKGWLSLNKNYVEIVK
ncbi:glycoside hydrolase family 25 protein [Terrisporobacter mayombei]|uniref:Uncharacterized protein n=1 Tax=Terrisporobacter mayombei TaxID=1541 RepID=A0ABY9Q0F8_9FIRM|nr:glycoside hydrolase family 25 protein [Terrisporobacter mayombei]MCC3868524.1 glycoside hydrolase family 25 protein [Terrisporobacter mayombei]WMT80681.1 hypothetical protein TEMA_10020 [Terrisporobacter mayombei]